MQIHTTRCFTMKTVQGNKVSHFQHLSVADSDVMRIP